MKKNLLSVVILALLIVNIVLTSVLMFSVMGTNKKTSELVGNIATVLNLELKPEGEEEAAPEISLADSEQYDIPDEMTIRLASDDGKEHYIAFKISFSVNSKDKEYKKVYGSLEELAKKQSLITDAVRTVVEKYTSQQCKDNFETVKAEILKAVQDLFQSEFIYKVAISDVKYM